MRIALTRLAVAIAAAGLVLLPGLPAAAHTYLEESEPMWETTVTEEITQIALRFNEPVLETIAEIEVTGPDGTSIFGSGPVSIDGVHVTRAVVPFTMHGEYRVDYMIVAGDGHPLEESFVFTYEGPLPEGAAAAPSPPISLPSPTSTADAPMAMDPSEDMSDMVMPSDTPSAMTMSPTEEASEDVAGGGRSFPSPTEEEAPSQVAITEPDLPMGRVWALVGSAGAALVLSMVAIGVVRRFEPPSETA